MILNFFIFSNFLSLAAGVNDKFRIKTYRVTVNVQDRYVRTEVAVQVKNKNLDETEKYEFGVKLDETEFISSLTMRVGKNNRYFYGEVHEQQTAIQIFNNAISQGQTAGLVQKEKDPLKDTTISTFVAIPPGEEAFFWLTYEQQLSRSYGKYKYKTNIRPYEPVDLVQVKVNIIESRNIKMKKTDVNFGDSQQIARNSGISKVVNNGRSVSYTYELPNDPDEFSETVFLTYDVDHPQLDGGDILIRDGYFVHFISPENLAPIAKNIIFVIDKSGSMSGDRILKTKEAFEYIVNDLNDDDHFQIVTFESSAYKLYDDFQPVNAETKADGVSKVQGIYAGGGTNIYDGMHLAVTQRNGNDAANIIIFITDGEPTSGIRDWETIRNNVMRDNNGYYAIFTFAIGSSAPYADLERLSTMNGGLARQIFSNTEVLDQIKDFYHGVATPLVWNAKIKYQNADDTITSSDMLFSGGEMVVVGKLKNCAAPVPSCNNKLLVNADHEDFCPTTQNLEINCTPRPTVPPFDPEDETRDKMANPKIPLDSDINLEKYFAYLQMARSLRIFKATDDETQRDQMKSQITQNAVQKGFVTRFTSMVVVEDDNVRKRRAVQNVRTKVKRSTEFQDELSEMFKQKTVEDLKLVERKRRSAEGLVHPRMTHSTKILLPLLAVVLVLRIVRRPFRCLLAKVC